MCSDIDGLPKSVNRIPPQTGWWDNLRVVLHRLHGNTRKYDITVTGAYDNNQWLKYCYLRDQTFCMWNAFSFQCLCRFLFPLNYLFIIVWCLHHQCEYSRKSSSLLTQEEMPGLLKYIHNQNITCTVRHFVYCGCYKNDKECNGLYDRRRQTGALVGSDLKKITK